MVEFKQNITDPIFCSSWQNPWRIEKDCKTTMKGLGLRRTGGVLHYWSVCDESSNTGCRGGNQNEFRAVTKMKLSVPMELEVRLHITGLRNDYCKLISSLWWFLQRLGILMCFSRKMAKVCPLHIKWKLWDICMVSFILQGCIFENRLSQDVDLLIKP